MARETKFLFCSRCEIRVDRRSAIPGTQCMANLTRGEKRTTHCTGLLRPPKQ